MNRGSTGPKNRKEQVEAGDSGLLARMLGGRAPQ